MTQRILVFLLLAASLYSCKQKPPPPQQESIYFSQKIKPFTDAITKDSTKGDAWYNRGIMLHRLKMDSLALIDFYRAAAIDTNKAVYASTIGDLLFEHKDVDASIQWLMKALRHDPDDVKAHLKLAKMMLFSKEYKIAIGEVNKVLRKDPYNAEGYFLKGMVYKEMKDTAKAISSFQTVINVAPDYRDATIQLGMIYCAKGSKLGPEYLMSAFRMDTSNVLPLYARGMYFQQQKDYERAKEEYKSCVLRDPQYSDAIFATGFILLQQDSFEKARRQFDLVTKVAPTNAVAYYNRGLCSELMNDKVAAAADYKQALTFDPNYTTAKEGLKRVGGK
ncbi:MAG: tetratricopeptide repeat protein [Chitinophagaceae bacterium]